LDIWIAYEAKTGRIKGTPSLTKEGALSNCPNWVWGGQRDDGFEVVRYRAIVNEPNTVWDEEHGPQPPEPAPPEEAGNG